MATFPDIKPTYNIKKSSKPKFRRVRFADGYEHRITFGLAEHSNPKEFKLTFIVSETDADTIETFLDDHGGTESFDYTPPEESTQMKFVCEVWDKTITFNNRATIQATFREVFEP